MKPEWSFFHLNILIADPSPVIRDIIMGSGIRADHPTCMFSVDGADALAKLKAAEFGFLLTEWDLPVMNGIELTRAVRSIQKLEKLPILMVSSRHANDDIEAAFAAGVNGYLPKPFHIGDFHRKIREVFSLQDTRELPPSDLELPDVTI